MTPRAEDPRPARTRAAILAAVETLSVSGADISIPAIVAEAGISRSTFYTHFADLDALAVRILTEVFADIEARDLELRRRDGAVAAARTAIEQLVAEFSKRRSLYAAVLGSLTTAGVQRAVQDAYAEQALGTLRETVPPQVDARTAADFLAGGTLAVITSWLLADPPTTTESVQSQLLALLPTWLIHDERTQDT